MLAKPRLPSAWFLQLNTGCLQGTRLHFVPTDREGNVSKCLTTVCKLVGGRILLFLTSGSSWQKLIPAHVLYSRSTMLMLKQMSGVICP